MLGYVSPRYWLSVGRRNGCTARRLHLPGDKSFYISLLSLFPVWVHFTIYIYFFMSRKSSTINIVFKLIVLTFCETCSFIYLAKSQVRNYMPPSCLYSKYETTRSQWASLARQTTSKECRCSEESAWCSVFSFGVSTGYFIGMIRL